MLPLIYTFMFVQNVTTLKFLQKYLFYQCPCDYFLAPIYSVSKLFIPKGSCVGQRPSVEQVTPVNNICRAGIMF